MSTVTPVPLHCVLEKVTGVAIVEAGCWVVRQSLSAVVEVNLPSLHSLHFLKGGKRGFGGQPSTIYLFTFTAMGVSGDQGFVHQPAPKLCQDPWIYLSLFSPAEMQGAVCWYIHDPQLRRELGGNPSISR